MICVPLPNTGQPVAWMLLVGLLLVGTGALLVLLAHRHRHRLSWAAVVVLLMVGTMLTGAGGHSPAQGEAIPCPPAPAEPGSPSSGHHDVWIVQTSVMSGMVPGQAPVAIIGVITNNASDSTYVEAVTVSIAGVGRVSGGVQGPCDLSDYVLVAPRMPLGLMLHPGARAVFSGASIGFKNKSINQDACKSAVVNLRYISS